MLYRRPQPKEIYSTFATSWVYTFRNSCPPSITIITLLSTKLLSRMCALYTKALSITHHFKSIMPGLRSTTAVLLNTSFTKMFLNVPLTLHSRNVLSTDPFKTKKKISIKIQHNIAFMCKIQKLNTRKVLLSFFLQNRAEAQRE